MRKFIQIAGVQTLDEALMLCRAGATHVGFPLCLDVHSEDMSIDETAHVATLLPDSSAGVLITYLNDPVEIITLAAKIQARTVQLHGPVPVSCLEELKRTAPDLYIIKSLVVRGKNLDNLLQVVQETKPYVDAFITDTFDPETGASGATGKTHDWAISRELVEKCNRPLILAGGLNPDNVAEAIKAVHPAGVDAHTGVEDDQGRKDPEKVRLFVERARLNLARLK